MKKFNYIFLVSLFVYSGIYGQKEEQQDVKQLMSTYYNDNFNPFQKSNWFFTLSLFLNNEKYENSEFRFEKILKGAKNNFEVDLKAGYFFSDYFAGSLAITYEGDDFNRKVPKLLSVIDKNSTTNTFGFSPALRSSIPIVPNQRLNLYVDLAMNFDWGKTTTEDFNKGELTGTSSANNFGFGVGIKPGITFFVVENFALEIGLEILGYSFESAKITFDDDTPDDKYTSNAIDFDLGLSTLQLSLSYYIGVKKNK